MVQPNRRFSTNTRGEPIGDPARGRIVWVMFAASLVAMVALSMSSPTQSTERMPTATVAQGDLIGREAAGVRAFKGIPYAAPPVGPLRWRPPLPVSPWSEPRDAGQVGAICIQPIVEGDTGVGPLPMSEDCLTLNVWTPTTASATTSAPVMVWIHGGGLNNGSGTAALYDGAALARRDVVVVTLNYRLGRLGFFDHPALAAERLPGEPAANYGLMDMIAALEWVHDNIAAFGGDPTNVTIFGESAGGAAVTRLMTSPTAEGLFHRAVVQSGLGREEGVSLDGPGPRGAPSIRDRGRAFGAWLGLGPDPSAQMLRDIDAKALLEPTPSFYGGDLLVIDGEIVVEDVSAAFAAGRQAKVPLIVGTNSAELWWVQPDEATPYGVLDDALSAGECAALEQAYGGIESYKASVMSDLVFNEPARHLARLHARSGNPTFLYRFDVVAEAMPEPHGGATHASERAYVFDNLTASSWATGARDQAAADRMAGYWTRFARSGDPNGVKAPDWPMLGTGPTAERLMEFTNDGPVAKAVPFADRLDLIEAYRARVSAPVEACPRPISR